MQLLLELCSDSRTRLIPLAGNDGRKYEVHLRACLRALNAPDESAWSFPPDRACVHRLACLRPYSFYSPKRFGYEAHQPESNRGTCDVQVLAERC